MMTSTNTGRTVKWFIASAVVLLVGMILALVEFYDVIYKE